MTLKTKPRNSHTPYIVDVYDAEQEDGSRVVARCDTRTGQIWKTKGSTVSLSTIREALAAR